MNLTQQRQAKIYHRDSEAKNFDAQIEFVRQHANQHIERLIQQRNNSAAAFDADIALIDEQIKKTLELVGVAA